MSRKSEQKVGIKKYVVMCVIYALMCIYCIDEKYYRSLWIPVVQVLLMIAAGMIRRGTFPWSGAYRISGLPGWMLVLSLVMLIPFSQINDNEMDRQYRERRSKETFVWPSSGLAEQLPDPVTNAGRIYTNNDLELSVDMYNVSTSRYNSYIKACKRKGFTDINYELDTSFSALNEEGYDLYCYLSSYGEMSVSLRSPKRLNRIDWPDNELLQLLPEPENLWGRIDADRSGYAGVCIGNIWENQFKEYVAACREAGFKKNYERKSDMYQANDADGNLLLLDLDEKTHTMYIQIWSAEEIAKYEDKVENTEAVESDSDLTEEVETEKEETTESDSDLTEEVKIEEQETKEEVEYNDPFVKKDKE